MIRTLLVTGLCALTLAGCGRTVVRETVVERPAATVAPPAVIATAPANCSLAGSAFGHGSMSCQLGRQHICNNGAWDRTAGYC